MFGKSWAYAALLALGSLCSAAPAAAATCSATDCIGVAKTASLTGRDVTFDVYVENLGSDDLVSISLTDDLVAAFGSGNFSIDSPPARISGPASIVPNTAFDGAGDTELLSSGSLLAGQSAQIRFTVSLSAVNTYTNVVAAAALGAVSNAATDDVSDNGTDPDPNGNGNPGDAGEDDPTPVDLAAQPRIGAAKSASVSGTQVALRFVLRNYGNRDLSNLSLTDDLDAVFGSGNYSVLGGGPSVISGSVAANAAFNGSSDTELLAAGSTLAIGAAAEVQLLVDVSNAVDVGFGVGAYRNQARVSATTAVGQLAADESTEGLDPDPNGNGIPTEGGENTPTVIVLGEEPAIGAAITAGVSGDFVTFDVYLENLGNVTLNALSLPADLNAVFGNGAYFLTSAPVFVQDPGTISLNAGFDGNFDSELIGSGSLAPGATARIQFQIDVLEVSDRGQGLGNYALQSAARGSAPGGGLALDASDDGVDPDPNGNGDAGDAGEDDATAFSVAARDSIGISKQYLSGGSSGGQPLVVLQFTLTNYGNRALNSITVSDNLNSVFGAGNFAHVEDPSAVNGSPTLNFNAAFNGNTNTSMLNAGSSLPAGETAVFRIIERVTNITDQGFGLGVYQNQVTVNALSPDATPVSDVSTEGANPDPDGNGAPDENVPTVININQTEALGVASNATVAGNVVTFDYALENLGSVGVSQISMLQNLDAVFGAGNYSIASAPAFVVDPGTLSLRGDFDGGAQAELFLPSGSSLSAGASAQVRLQVQVNRIENVGLGIGNYSSQTVVRGLSDLGQLLSDPSDSGTDPDPNGNGQPNEAGENDATVFSLAVDNAVGVAKSAAISGFTVTFDLFLENLGATTLSSISLGDSLDTAFGAGNYSLSSLPVFIDDPGTLSLNPGFDGGADSQLLAAGGSLVAGDTAQIRFDVTINTESDQGFGFGVYRSQAEVVATLPSGVVVGDRSDNGSDPDPNGNGDPSEAGEEDFTPVVIAGNPAVGVAKKALVNGTQVTFEFTITNLGDVTLSNFLLTDPLNPVFGSGNYSIQTQPVRVSGATTLLLSPQFFGFNIFDRIVVGGTLRPGETEVVRTQINVNTVTDLGNGFGIYNNSVTVTATGPDGAMVTDVSDDGVVADPNGNGDAGDAGEDDPTRIIIGDEARIGIAQAASVSGQQVTLDFYIENFGNSALSNLSLIEDLDAVFGAGNYALAAPPSLVDDPGTLTLNAGFDGSASAELIGAGSTLLALDTAQIRLVIDVTPTDQGAGLGNYSDQVSISAEAPLGSLASDVSDSGTDPDPNGNGFSNDEAESDRTVFSVSTSQLGAALNATVSGRVVTLDYYIENLGSTPFASASASQDLDAVFGAGNYRLLSGPTQVSIPRALILNSAFDGSGNTQLISSGGISLGVTEQIRLVVSVDRLADLGSGLGVYNAQFTALADATSDLSDAGTVTDANNSGFANEAGEDDPTGFSVAPEPVVGVAKTVGVSGSNAQVDLYLESFANVELSNLSLVDDLDAVFGAGNYSIGTGPVLIDDPGTLALNPGFNGSSSADLLAAGSTLAIGDTAQLRFSVIISNPTDQGSGLGRFSNQATVSAQAPDSSSFNDASDDGVDPDADGDGNPNETGENDPSVFELQSRIDGLVYTDLNGDGSPAGEPGRSGVTVFLDSNGNGSLDGGEPSRVTDGAGLYSFIGLANGSYQVRVDLAGIPSGFVLTGGVNPALLTPVPGQTAAVNFGFQQQDAGIGDLVWNDLNGDGSIDGGEPGLGGVTVYLDLNSNGSLDGGEPSSVSDGSGAYALGGLAAGSYLVRIDPTTVPAGFVLTGGTLPLTLNLAAGEVRSTADFGYQQQDASIGDLVWNDLNGNGLVDGGEPGLSGVRVYLDLNNNNIAEAGEPQALTDGSGAYDFTALGAGAYVVRIDPSTVPLTLGLTTGNLPLSVSLAAGEDFNSADFGYVQRVEPGFAKAFANEPIRVAESVALVFTIDNSGSAFVASALAFTDALPAGMTVASPANASTTCSSGTLAAVAGSSTFSYSGGTLAAGSVCTVAVDVRVAAAGTYMNTSGDLTSSLGNSGPASATLRAVDSALTLSKTWLSAPVLPGGNVALRYRIENGSADFGADAVAFDDNLDQALAGLVRTNTLAVTGCGPTASISGTSTVSVSGLSIAAGSACEVDVQVQVPVAASNGSYAGSTGPLTASVLGLSVTGSAASASLDVARLAFSKAFVGTPLAAGTIDLLFTLSNPDPVNGASGISFVDDLSLMGIALSAEGLPASNVCGAGSSLTGPSSLQLSSGSLPGGGQCQFVARLRLPTLLTNGTYPNVTGPLQSTVNGLAVAGGSADVAAAELQISGVPLQPASPTIVPAAQSWVLALLASLLALVAVLQIRSRQ